MVALRAGFALGGLAWSGVRGRAGEEAARLSRVSTLCVTESTGVCGLQCTVAGRR